MTNSKKDSESNRILGDLRIFQSVYADLASVLTHVPGENAYVYKGIDPYELEDERFTITVEAIKTKYITKEESDRRVLEARTEEAKSLGVGKPPKEHAKNIQYMSGFNYARNTLARQRATRLAELRELLNGDTDG